MRTISDAERRTRLMTRHGLTPEHRPRSVEEAVEQVVALHATEPHTVYLSLAARVPGLTVADVDRALYQQRTVVKQLAMRRTLWACPRDLLPALWGSASARVALQQEKRVAKEVEDHDIAADGSAWLARAEAAVLARLAGGEEVSATQLRAELVELEGRTRADPDKRHATSQPVGRHVLTVLGARGLVLRGHNAGHWRTNRNAWVSAPAWLGEAPAPLGESEGYAELVRRWLARFGPGTEADLVWWLGATRGAVRRALADVGAVTVGLESGAEGWVLADDEDPVEPVAPAAALLPVLDPTTMGWRDRDFHLHRDHTAHLFDVNGNAGTTAWWDGRVVGCWVQHDDEVEVRLCEDVGAHASAALEAEAQRLSAWLGDVVISSVYKSPLMKQRA